MLITKSWPGRLYWQADALEKRIFSSRSSGDLFFDNCSKILLDRDYKYRELAMCFYLCLCSGFRGKYHQKENQNKIEQVKTDLFHFYSEGNFDVSNSLSGILPSTLYSTMSDSTFENSYKKTMYSLLMFNLFLFATFLVASIYIWYTNSNILSKGIIS